MKNSILTEEEITAIWSQVNLMISFCNPEFKENAKEKGIQGMILIIFGIIILIYDSDLFISSIMSILIGLASSLSGYLENKRISGN